MDIRRENLDGGRILIRTTVAESDYNNAVEKALKEYKRKANVPGFRPGMVPMALVNKLYRKGVLAEEAYKMASQATFDYIEKEKIDFLGDVLPADEQGALDFDNAEEFEFVFEVGLAPEVNIELTDKDKITRYRIEPDAEMKKNYRTNFLRRYGRLEDADKVGKDEALSATLDNDQMQIEEAYVGLVQMDDKARKPFIGKKVGDTMNVDITELYPTTAQRAAILKMKEDELDGIDPKFKLTITKIRKFVEPTLDAEFFAQAFPGGEVKDEAEFDAFITGQITRDLDRETDYVFTFQMRKMLLDKAALAMPEAFLKRWLFTINKGRFTMEQIESELPQFVDMMRWNLIQKYYADKLGIKLEPEDAMTEAKRYAAMQFAQYGMANVGDDVLTNYAQQMLQNKDEARKIYDRLFEQKVIDAVAATIKVADKTVSPEEFNKLAEKL